MDFDGNFRDLPPVDVTKLVGLLPTLEDPIWETNTRHQQFPTHMQTRTIVVNDFPLTWDGTGFPSKKVLYGLTADATMEIANTLAAAQNKRLGRVLLIRLIPNSNITPHADGGLYLNKVKRIHIPLVTDPLVIFTVNGEARHLPVGSCTEINNLRVHSVNNNSTIHRIHLLIDLL